MSTNVGINNKIIAFHSKYNYEKLMKVEKANTPTTEQGRANLSPNK